MRFFKRLAYVLVFALVLGGVGAGVMFHLSNRTPTGYDPHALSDAQRTQAANVVETQKIPRLLNLASAAQNQANRAHRGQAAQAPDPVTVTFTQDEVNAFLWKWWTVDPATTRKFETYVTKPFVRLEEGKLVMMGTVAEYDKVISLFFEPRIDKAGMLHCDMTSLRLGNLPLPESLLAKHRAKIEDALKSKLPAWQRSADIDPTGVTNPDARAAALSKIVLLLLNHEPVPAVLFLPKDGGVARVSKTVPVRLTQVALEQGALTITVQPMETQERVALLEKIRQPFRPVGDPPIPAPPGSTNQ